jgi:hypothetical protein
MMMMMVDGIPSSGYMQQKTKNRHHASLDTIRPKYGCRKLDGYEVGHSGSQESYRYPVSTLVFITQSHRSLGRSRDD